MDDNPKTTAVVIMVKQPEPGKVKTRLTPMIAPLDAAELYAGMIRDITFACQMVEKITFYYACTPASASDYFEHFAPGNVSVIGVEGADIGRCIHEAMRMMEFNGHARFAAVASDCPLIQSWHIRLGFQRLEHADVVIGPSTDGGYYFIGVKETHSELFDSDLPWSTPQILAATLQRASELNLTVDFIPPLSDIDTPEDLANLWAILSGIDLSIAQFTRHQMEVLYKRYPEFDKFYAQRFAREKPELPFMKEG